MEGAGCAGGTPSPEPAPLLQQEQDLGSPVNRRRSHTRGRKQSSQGCLTASGPALLPKTLLKPGTLTLMVCPRHALPLPQGLSTPTCSLRF